MPDPTPRRALVTGGAGFIGSHLAETLLAQGCEVTVIDDLSTGRRGRVPAAATFHELDIVDAPALDRAVDGFAPTEVYHVAAQSSVIASVADPARDCTVNVLGTLHVLVAAERHRAPVVFTSTGGALYGDAAPMPTPEDRIPAPLSPYGSSKWAAEAYVLTWSAASGIPHAVCRLGNVYGPRQSPHGEAGVVAIFTHHLYTGQAPKLYGEGRPTRDYVHVDDVVRGLLAASSRAGTFNIATGVETAVSEIWSTLRDEAGVELEPQPAPLRPGELQHSCLDISRAAQELDWRPQVTITDGLRETYRALVAEFEESPPA